MEIKDIINELELDINRIAEYDNIHINLSVKNLLRTYNKCINNDLLEDTEIYDINNKLEFYYDMIEYHLRETYFEDELGDIRVRLFNEIDEYLTYIEEVLLSLEMYESLENLKRRELR